MQEFFSCSSCLIQVNRMTNINNHFVVKDLEATRITEGKEVDLGNLSSPSLKSSIPAT